MLSRMGFNVDRDEAPVTKPKKIRPAGAKPIEGAPRWQGQFRALSSALGLNPDAMLETFCRDWVETTKSRALAPGEPPKQLPAGSEAPEI